MWKEVSSWRAHGRKPWDSDSCVRHRGRELTCDDRVWTDSHGNEYYYNVRLKRGFVVKVK